MNLQMIMLSEKFQHLLLVMERSILGNTFQPKLAAYRQLPILEGKVNSLLQWEAFFCPQKHCHTGDNVEELFRPHN